MQLLEFASQHVIIITVIHKLPDATQVPAWLSEWPQCVTSCQYGVREDETRGSSVVSVSCCRSSMSMKVICSQHGSRAADINLHGCRTVAAVQASTEHVAGCMLNIGVL